MDTLNLAETSKKAISQLEREWELPPGIILLSLPRTSSARRCTRIGRAIYSID